MPSNVGLQELNNGQQLVPGSIPFGPSTVLIATWISSYNNFQSTSFFIMPVNGGPRINLGVVPAASAQISSLGGGKYQGVFTLKADTSRFYNPNKYFFSYVGTCSDLSSISYVDTSAYPSGNAPPKS